MYRTIFTTLLMLSAATARSQSVDTTWLHEIESSREQFKDYLAHSTQSYFAAVERVDFGDKTSLVIGSAADADVRLDDASIMPHHVRITREADGFSLAALDPGAFVGTPAGNERTAHVGPSSLSLGRFSLRLSHQGYPAVIVFDPKSPYFASTERPDWFAPDPKYRVHAKLALDPKPQQIEILSTRGNRRKALKLGAFEFTIDGQQVTLEANRLLEPGVGENSISIFFRDQTTGKESYPVGRYVEPERHGDEWIIDFNSAYNPACAYSEHYNCPIPPEANHLKIPILAGEKHPIGGH